MAPSAELLSAFDRCPKCAFHLRSWELNRVLPNEALRRAVDVGLEGEEDDPGQLAGDTVYDLAANRGLLTHQFEVFDQALHLAALADIVVTHLRTEGPWERPEDFDGGNLHWTSSSFLEASGVRLRRILLVDRWSKEREEAERHSWKTLGECSIYQMPQTITVINIGQTRDGKHHSSWSKGWTHPKSRELRLRKRSGEGFGGNWNPIWREESSINREYWLEHMVEDEVMQDCRFDLEVEIPESNIGQRMRDLAARNLERMQKQADMSVSACFFPTPCPFTAHCWEGVELSEREGYVRIT